MKKILMIAAALCCAAVLTVNGADDKKAPEKKGEKKKVELTDAQKTLLKELMEKYDANKDKKLDKDERAKISDEDKKKALEAKLPGFGPGKKKENK